MPTAFKMTRTVAFSETDAAGIVHFAQFFRYMEDAEHAMLRSLGLSVHQSIDNGVAGFPRVSAQCDYRKPLKFEDVFVIEARVAAKTDKAVTYGFSFYKEGEEQLIATGTLKAVYAVKPNGAEKFSAATLPTAIDSALVVTDADTPS